MPGQAELFSLSCPLMFTVYFVYRWPRWTNNSSWRIYSSLFIRFFEGKQFPDSSTWLFLQCGNSLRYIYQTFIEFPVIEIWSCRSTIKQISWSSVFNLKNSVTLLQYLAVNRTYGRNTSQLILTPHLLKKYWQTFLTLPNPYSIVIILLFLQRHWSRFPMLSFWKYTPDSWTYRR